MKMTLLDMVQSIMSDIDSDEVNSYTDTPEAKQVAEIIRQTYFNIITRANLPEHNSLFQLTASGNVSLPVVMYRPDDVVKVDWIKYNKDTDDVDTNVEYGYVTILPLQQFLDMIHAFNPDEDNVESMDIDSITYYFRTDRAPCYCTILNDSTFIFDSYDNEVDTTLQTSKTLAFGRVVPTFTMADAFVPNLDDQQFPLLLSEAKTVAFFQMKQQQNPLSARESKRQWSALAKDKELKKPSYFDQLPNFGRK